MFLFAVIAFIVAILVKPISPHPLIHLIFTLIGTFIVLGIFNN